MPIATAERKRILKELSDWDLTAEQQEELCKILLEENSQISIATAERERILKELSRCERKAPKRSSGLRPRGFGPVLNEKYIEEKNMWEVSIKPGSGFKKSFKAVLTEEQHEKFRKILEEKFKTQKTFTELSHEVRKDLISHITPEE
jgi:hypothetical protein